MGLFPYELWLYGLELDHDSWLKLAECGAVALPAWVPSDFILMEFAVSGSGTSKLRYCTLSDLMAALITEQETRILTENGN